MPTKKPLLQVAVQLRQRPLELDVAFALTEPWTVLFGSSGSGKTTLLRAIMGFVRVDNGRILVGNMPILDTADRIVIPPHLRGIRFAGQAAHLFPGISVRENLRYGVRAPGNETVLLDEVLQLFRIDQLAEKPPLTLSGGERQRVSVARAVASAAASGSALLLLDEPFAGLELTLRDALALDLQRWLLKRSLTVLSVTHDVGEAFLLSAEVLRLEDGRIAEQGPVGLVLARERERLLMQLRDGQSHPT